MPFPPREAGISDAPCGAPTDPEGDDARIEPRGSKNIHLKIGPDQLALDRGEPSWRKGVFHLVGARLEVSRSCGAAWKLKE